MDMTIQGAEDLATLGRAMKGAEKSLKRNLLREFRLAARPAGEAVRDAYGRRLPQRGGLAARIRASTISAQTRTGGRSVGVKLTLRNRHDLNSIERGRLRHPVYGNRDVWVQQPVPAEIGTDAFEGHKSELQRRVYAAMERAAHEIVKG